MVAYHKWKRVDEPPFGSRRQVFTVQRPPRLLLPFRRWLARRQHVFAGYEEQYNPDDQNNESLYTFHKLFHTHVEHLLLLLYNEWQLVCNVTS